MQKALPLLPDGASIILNASTTSAQGVPAFSVYSASKAAVRSFARTWTTDLKARKIRVNAISPRATETPGLVGLAKNEEQKQAMFAQFQSEVPFGRIAQPEEITKVVLFLASDDASYITGIELFVDGGAAQVQDMKCDTPWDGLWQGSSKAHRFGTKVSVLISICFDRRFYLFVKDSADRHIGQGSDPSVGMQNRSLRKEVCFERLTRLRGKSAT